ncbi:alpha/beta fold hydrolase [Promicromonospora iranensis]|uniref:Pimeloyl-ACP methyl ester carboxylesterase n=1 Tax=Promicromonospora iranensis TaxID=1105144 RepID=A0ABU2CV95_9MICO|nr:alpha/beta hydrolase [Promicromonospora iranensis]MDR7385264.1 pimeloyl-ACP methyl ester carboxylesterase [Promicromonospora iranensis]
MPQTQRVARATFRALGRTAPPLALALGAATYWQVGPPAPVRLADQPVHDSARRGSLAHRPTFRSPAGQDRQHGPGRTVPVATYAWGDPGAPAVLLVHGWRSRASAFGRIIEDLTGAGLRVVAYDAPAHGASGGRRRSGLDDLDIIRRLSDAEDAPWAAVVGHSLGVLAAGVALHEGVRAERFTGISGLTSVRATTDGFIRAAGIPWDLRDRFATAVQRYGLPGHPDIYERFDLLTRAVPAPIPTLWVHDAGDRMNPHVLSERLHDVHAASSELFTTTGLGHNKILGDPAVRTRILDHLAAPASA